MHCTRLLPWALALSALLAGCDDSAEPVAADGAPPELALDASPRPDQASNVTPDGGPDAQLDAEVHSSDLGLPPLPAPEAPPACGETVALSTALPGLAAPGHDAELAAKAHRIDRLWRAISAFGTGGNADVGVVDRAARDAVQAFADGDGWAFEGDLGALTGSFGKVTGLYAGAGIVADAHRYRALRDGGADCAEVERARAHLRTGLEVLARVVRITGTPGVIARAIARRDLPGQGQVEVTPLFDADGAPLPEEKNNGTWRADNGGQDPDWIWEDSCSRDMYLGWAWAFAAAWEAVAHDPDFTDAEKQALREAATALLDGLRAVQDSGYDLEIRDADGRRTYHGILNENSVDRVYVDGAPNGFNAFMAVGIVAALAHVSQAPWQQAWLADDLVAVRGLLQMARDSMIGLDLGVGSNYSGYNMAFTAGWLAVRYLPDAADRALAADVVQAAIYQRPDAERQPVEQSQALYHLVAHMAAAGHSAFGPGAGDSAPLAATVAVLRDYPAAPLWDDPRENCDAAELEAGVCEAVDGTQVEVHPSTGRGGTIVSRGPLPIHLRPPSNYYWRSNPYQLNGGGDGLTLLPAVDFRAIYWAARDLRVEP
ncbi:MAG: hypothetical protein H6702_20500 [Myxococcales bacterium]|nr:hypothetical protein [Myxococcales bacterium]